MKDLTNPLEIALNRLRQHIGAPGWTPGPPEEFFAEWTRQLAALVERHTVLHRYGAEVRGWCNDIKHTPTPLMLDDCRAVQSNILRLDNVDGWPTDRAGNALYQVCMGALYSLDPKHAEHSRWPDEASCKVWEYVTGASAFNEVVDVSRKAWQRHLWAQTLGAMSTLKDDLEDINDRAGCCGSRAGQSTMTVGSASIPGSSLSG